MSRPSLTRTNLRTMQSRSATSLGNSQVVKGLAVPAVCQQLRTLVLYTCVPNSERTPRGSGSAPEGKEILNVHNRISFVLPPEMRSISASTSFQSFAFCNISPSPRAKRRPYRLHFRGGCFGFSRCIKQLHPQRIEHSAIHSRSRESAHCISAGSPSGIISLTTTALPCSPHALMSAAPTSSSPNLPRPRPGRGQIPPAQAASSASSPSSSTMAKNSSPRFPTAQQPPHLTHVMCAFGTRDIARILARITCGLLRATALEDKVHHNAARLDAPAAPTRRIPAQPVRASPAPRQASSVPISRHSPSPRQSRSLPRSAPSPSAPSSPTSATISASARTIRCGRSCRPSSRNTAATTPAW